MNVAHPDPSTILPFEFKINRQADIYITLLQDGDPIASVTGWTWALSIKRYPGSRTNLINLTLGNGLSYDTYSEIVLHAHFTSAQCNIDEGEYFIQLTRTDIEKTWIEGVCNFRFAKVNSQEVMSSELTLDINSDTQDITLNIISGRIITITQTGTSYTFSNGLTESGGAVKLGGALVDSITNISVPTGKTLNVLDANENTGLSVNGTSLFISIFGGSSGSDSITLTLRGGNGATAGVYDDQRSGANAMGLRYAADYSANYTDRSLVDRGSGDARWTKQINTPTAITDGATITLTTAEHTLSTAQAAISVTDNYTGDYCGVRLTLSGITACTLTFVTGTAFGVFNGTASGDNTMAITGVAGDVIEISRKKLGTVYTYVGLNRGQ